MISVIIPCHDGAATVGRAIASVLDGTEAAVEIVVVDDASTDGTRAVLADAAARDPRIRPVHLARNLGASAAQNAGLAAARGDWIAILDHDDRYEAGRLDYLLDAALRHGADMVADDQKIVTWPDGRILGTAFRFIGGESRRMTIDDILDLSTGDREEFGPGYAKLMVRKAFLDRHGLRFDPARRILYDFEFLVDCLMCAPVFVWCARPLYLYSIRPDSLSNSGGHTLALIVEQAGSLLARHGGRLGPRGRAALVARRSNYGRLHLAWAVKQAVRRRDWRALAGLLARPRGLADLWWAWRRKRRNAKHVALDASGNVTSIH